MFDRILWIVERNIFDSYGTFTLVIVREVTLCSDLSPMWIVDNAGRSDHSNQPVEPDKKTSLVPWKESLPRFSSAN